MDLTEQEILDRLAEIRAAMSEIRKAKFGQYSVGGRQVTITGASAYEQYAADEKFWMTQLARVRGGGGIRIRYGVPR
jgi:hypothetical protein